MSYALSAALQAAVYARLSGDAALDGLVAGAIYDALPPGPLPPLYVMLGPEKVRDRSDQTGRGAVHDFTVSVVSESAGFAAAKTAAAAANDALLGPALTMGRGHLVSLAFLDAKAARAKSGSLRQIDMTFRARVEDDAL